MAGDGIPYDLLLPQALIGLVDALSYMVTSPSLVFYVLAKGGTYSQYGVILSVFSFSSFVFKPILGLWCDRAGGKFRMPYLSSISVAALGGLVYFLASAFQGPTAIALIFIGRFLGGAGAANQTLGFTYIAQVMPSDKLTQSSAVLSMVRIVGMVVAPGLNVLLNLVNVDITVGPYKFQLNPLNSVGLFIMLGNMTTFFIVYVLLKEPPAETKEKRDKSIDSMDERSWTFWRNVLTPEILVPMISIFCLNASFQLMEACLAPAANDALGWGPVGVSGLFGANACFIFVAVIATFRLSSSGVKDEVLLKIGLMFSISGYLSIYLFWKNPVDVFRFSFPIVLSTFAFPFMGSPTRSLFTRSVEHNEILRSRQGTMQALLSMVSSVAGFVAPGLVSVYVLRTPDEVAASRDHRELTAWALFAPFLGVLTLLGYLYLDYTVKQTTTSSGGEGGERQALVGEETKPPFHPKVEGYRRQSVTLMGIPQFSFSDFRGAPPTRRHTTILTSSSVLPTTAESSNRRISSAF